MWLKMAENDQETVTSLTEAVTAVTARVMTSTTAMLQDVTTERDLTTAAPLEGAGGGSEAKPVPLEFIVLPCILLGIPVLVLLFCLAKSALNRKAVEYDERRNPLKASLKATKYRKEVPSTTASRGSSASSGNSNATRVTPVT